MVETCCHGDRDTSVTFGLFWSLTTDLDEDLIRYQTAACFPAHSFSHRLFSKNIQITWLFGGKERVLKRDQDQTFSPEHFTLDVTWREVLNIFYLNERDWSAESLGLFCLLWVKLTKGLRGFLWIYVWLSFHLRGLKSLWGFPNTDAQWNQRISPPVSSSHIFLHLLQSADHRPLPGCLQGSDAVGTAPCFAGWRCWVGTAPSPVTGRCAASLAARETPATRTTSTTPATGTTSTTPAHPATPATGTTSTTPATRTTSATSAFSAARAHRWTTAGQSRQILHARWAEPTEPNWFELYADEKQKWDMFNPRPSLPGGMILV